MDETGPPLEVGTVTSWVAGDVPRNGGAALESQGMSCCQKSPVRLPCDSGGKGWHV